MFVRFIHLVACRYGLFILLLYNISFEKKISFDDHILIYLPSFLSVPVSSTGKESACNAGNPSSIPGSGRFPCRRDRLPTPVFLPGESHGQRSLVSSSVQYMGSQRLVHD